AALVERAANPGAEPIGQLATVRTIIIGNRPAISSARPILPSSARMQIEAGQEFIAISVQFLSLPFDLGRSIGHHLFKMVAVMGELRLAVQQGQ
ncbi:ATPase, partial [Rhizobium ruizarguesonis]